MYKTLQDIYNSAIMTIEDKDSDIVQIEDANKTLNNIVHSFHITPEQG